MLSFNQFIHDSKDHPFEYIKKGSIILWAGGKHKVTNASHGIITIPGKVRDITINKNQWKERSRTYDGIAAAMANQWGQVRL